MATIRLSVPKRARQGEVIQIRALIQHPMETGYRRGSRGEVIPRDIITDFECIYEGEIVFRARFHRGVAANPFLSFYTTATTSGELVFRWTDEHGESWSDSAMIEVS